MRVVLAALAGFFAVAFVAWVTCVIINTDIERAILVIEVSGVLGAIAAGVFARRRKSRA